MNLGIIWAIIATSASAFNAAQGSGLTKLHENGRCAMRGQCGKESFFGGELPCADNGRAEDPGPDLRQKLSEVCGQKWSQGPICCNEDQVDALHEKLKQADSLISSCPACRENFYNLFCTFTCSPDQSTFVNVTDTMEKNGKILVTELDNLWSDDYGTGFYESCKDVKFGPANTPAMSFIGGGAKNYTELFKFLGKKSPLLGSPFQINFPRPDKGQFPGMKPVATQAISCSTTDDNYRCTCVDCNSSCMDPPPAPKTTFCHVGTWPCLSFAVVLVYSILVFFLTLAISGHVAYRRHVQNNDDRMRLLQDVVDSENEDDDDIVYSAQSPVHSIPHHYALNVWCDRLFRKLARVASQFPSLTIGTSLLFAGLLSLGWLRFEVEKDPVKLWVAPESNAAQQKSFFDTNFGPFFRAEQAFLVNDTEANHHGPVLSYETLKWWFGVEERVKLLAGEDTGAVLDDICYKPTEDSCVIQSVSGYFQNTGLDKSMWQEQIIGCTQNPSSCLPDFGLPLDPSLILGAHDETYLDSPAMITTWVVSNDQEKSRQFQMAVSWEKSMKELMLSVQAEARERGLRLSFSTEISLEHELSKSTNTDARIVVISYMIMFLYASLALGSTTLTVRSILRKPSILLVQSKFTLGVIGILIVLLSVSASVGLFSAMGVKVTLIIAEVIPFLILAIGVDNIFLIVHEFERVNDARPELPVEERLARTLGRIGPSILLSASMQTITFSLGAFVSMPAVRNFAVYAAGAVLVNALLQITMFIAVLSLNQQRVEMGRADCIPCLQVNHISLDDNPAQLPNEQGGLQRFIQRTYAPAILGKKSKILISTIFLGVFTIGLALLPNVKLGLDQRIAIPDDSYLTAYFNDLYDYFDSGPPLYFVARELNVTQREIQKQLCGRFSTCHQRSLATLLEQERKRPDVSYIASSTANWVDDFFLWLNPVFDMCCSDNGHACFENRDPPWNPQLRGMPVGREYVEYLERWLNSPTNQDCPLGGKAAYSNAVVVDNTSLTITASHFRTAHTPLRSQDDLINSYAAAKRISAEISAANPGLDIFPYSKHYIFFDQYSTIINVTIALVGTALGACFLISSIFLGSIRTGLVVALTVAMTVIDIGGAMAIAGVSLNAVTLVNLVICVGIAVEFCAHIARAFQFPATQLLDQSGAVSSRLFHLNKPNVNTATASASLTGRDARAWAALSLVGGSVFSGITITKLLGVCVLAFTRSKIFEIYYFRVWLSLVLIAASHSLILLPVLLSWFGSPNGYSDSDSESRLEDDLTRRRWYLDEHVDDDHE